MTWIYLQGKICSQFRLLVWTSFIGRFVYHEGMGKMGGWGGGYLYFSQLGVLLYEGT